MAAGDTDTIVISACIIVISATKTIVLCFPNNLTQSVYESVFRFILCFSHVLLIWVVFSCEESFPLFRAQAMIRYSKYLINTS